MKVCIYLRCINTLLNNNTIFFVTDIRLGKFTMLILCKYGFKVCVILFYFYSTHYKDYIHLPCINTHLRTTAPFETHQVISYSYHWRQRLYQGSAYCCEGDCNSKINRLLQLFRTIHYCNQSVLVIVPEMNIIFWSITILISFCEAPWYSYFLLRASYLYNSIGLKLYIFGLLLNSRICDVHFYGWVHCIVTTEMQFKGLCGIVWFLIILFEILYSFTLH